VEVFLVLKYIENIKLYELINSIVVLKVYFGNKGLNLQQFLKQINKLYLKNKPIPIILQHPSNRLTFAK
jgi:hypothetical protein